MTGGDLSGGIGRGCGWGCLAVLVFDLLLLAAAFAAGWWVRGWGQ